MRGRGMLRLGVALVAALVLVSVGAAGGFLVGRANPGLLGPVTVRQADPSLDLSIFWEAWGYLKQEYYRRPLDQQALVRGAVRGMLEATGDANTGYLAPEAYELAGQDLQGSFDGIGAELGARDGELVVIAPMPGSPAEKAGLRPGDVIRRIDGEDATHLSALDAASRVRGPKGTSVRLTVERPRDPSSLDAPSRDALLAALPTLEAALRANDAARAREAASAVNEALRALAGATSQSEVTIVRDTILIARVEERMLDGGVGYLRLPQFSRGSAAQLDEALRALLEDHPRALVLDLRRDSGGYVDEAIGAASEFLPADRPVFTEERADGVRRDYRSRGGGRATDLPLVVLVDQGTASAAEILAAALHDDGRARLVGDTTYGKGTEQYWHTLDDGSGVRVTVARWLTPAGVWVDHEGIRPDVEVVDADPNPPDLQLERALALLR